MTKDTPTEIQETDLDHANGGFRLEHDADPVVSKPKRKPNSNLISMGEGETCGI